MKRRHFIGATAATSIALVTRPGSSPSAFAQGASRPQKVLMHVGTQQNLRVDTPEAAKTLSYFKRHGVDNICAYVNREDRSVEKLSRLRQFVESHGISLDMIDDMRLARSPMNPIMMGKSPERDRDIEEVCELIRNCAKVGIPAVKYYLSLLPILSTSRTPGRGGSTARTWKLSEYKEADQPTEAGPVPAELMWERITYFLERVIPVATEYKIRMAHHPHDVPTPPRFRQINQVLGTPDGLKKFVSIQESPYHGLNLCLGTTAEMLQNPRTEIFPIIRYFGERKKIFNIHFRNIRGKRDDFQETYPDNGDMDMVRVALALKEVDYPYMLMPDHMPSHSDDPGTLQGFAYGYGYIKGVIQAVSQLS
jgi:mannonate dehydratase